MSIELWERVCHSLVSQPFDRGTVLSVIEITHYQRWQFRLTRWIEPPHFLQPILSGKQITTQSPTAALADGRV